MQVEEIWKPIIGYEGYYEVSNLGRVKRVALTKQVFRGGKSMLFHHKERILNGGLNIDGYNRVELSVKPGATKRTCVFNHRLVAESFILNPDNKDQVNHINGIKTDNRFHNLEWCTGKENVRHAIKTGLRTANKGSKCGSSKLKESQVLEIRELFSKGLGTKQISEIYSMHQSTISAIKTGRNWNHI